MSLTRTGSMNELTRPDYVLFDLDNTLYLYDPAHEAALKAVAEKLNQKASLSQQQFDDFLAQAKKEIKSRLGNVASAHSRLLYFHRLVELVGLRSQPQLVLDLEQTYWRTFLAHGALFPDVIDFLDELRIAGVRTAIVTDLTIQIQLRKVLYWELDSYFDYIVTSEETGVEKPDPLPFQMAVEKLEASQGTIWMIGDNPINDIKGAREALGCITLQKVHTGVTVLQGIDAPDFIFDTFADIRREFYSAVPTKGKKECH